MVYLCSRLDTQSFTLCLEFRTFSLSSFTKHIQYIIKNAKVAAKVNKLGSRRLCICLSWPWPLKLSQALRGHFRHAAAAKNDMTSGTSNSMANRHKPQFPHRRKNIWWQSGKWSNWKRLWSDQGRRAARPIGLSGCIPSLPFGNLLWEFNWILPEHLRHRLAHSSPS